MDTTTCTASWWVLYGLSIEWIFGTSLIALCCGIGAIAIREARKKRGKTWPDEYLLMTNTQLFSSWFAVVNLTGSLAFASVGWGETLTGTPATTCTIHYAKVAQALILAYWILSPPLWLWFEYNFSLRPTLAEAKPENRPDMKDHYKYNQDLSAKVWVALVSVLFLLYFWKDLKR